ncbi:MAG: hypothetical protein AAF721_09235 [Myxococcota bacterium]
MRRRGRRAGRRSTTLVGGKADGLGDDAQARRAAVVRVASEQTAEVLDDVVALDGRAVANIVEVRDQRSDHCPIAVAVNLPTRF